MGNIETINIDLHSPATYEVIKAQQGDNNSRIIEVVLTDQGKDYNLQEQNVSLVQFQGDKANGKSFIKGCSYHGNVVTIVLDSDILHYAGICRGRIVMYSPNNESIMSTPTIKISVQADPCSDKENITEEDINLIDQLEMVIAKELEGFNNHVSNTDIHVDKSLYDTIDAKAPIDNPVFTGTPEAPTADSGTNTTQIATTAFVQNEIANLVDSAPETMNTLKELADAIDKNAKSVAQSTTGVNPTLINSTLAPLISIHVNGATEQQNNSYVCTNKLNGLELANYLVENCDATLDTTDKTIKLKETNVGIDNVLFDDFEEGKQYTFILYGKKTGTTAITTKTAVYYTDGTKTEIKFENQSGSYAIFTTDSSKSIDSWKGIDNSSSSYTIFYYEQCGIFEGEVTQENFEPYSDHAIVSPTIKYPEDIHGLYESGSVDIKTTNGDGTQFTIANIPISKPLYEGDYVCYNMDGSGEEKHSKQSVVFDGSDDEVWNYTTDDNGIYYAYIPTNPLAKPQDINIYSSHYKNNGTTDNVDRNIYISLNNDIIIRDSRFTTVEEWKTWLSENNVTVVYKLAEPTVTPLTAEQIAEFEKLQTFDETTDMICDGEVEVDYFNDNINGKTVVMCGRIPKITVDSELSETSENAVQNKIVTESLNDKLNSDGTAVNAKRLSNTEDIGSATQPVYFNANGVPVAGTYTLAAACARGVKSLTSTGDLGWGTNNDYVPDLSVLARWNGAHSGTSSNLAYCNKGAFGAAAIKGVDTTATSGSANLITSGAMYTALAGKLSTSGGTLSGALNTSSYFKYTTTQAAIVCPDEGALFVSLTGNKVTSLGTFGTYRFGQSMFVPGKDNTSSCGSSNYRWDKICSATSAISTSDRKLKDNMQPLSDIYYQLFLKLMPMSFTFVDGTSGRTHVGFVSQDVEETMYELGMTSLDFAGFCRDVKTKIITEEYEVTNENGEPILDENGDVITDIRGYEVPDLDEDGNEQYIYSLRYEEFIGIVTDALQRTIKRQDSLEERINILEEKINRL